MIKELKRKKVEEAGDSKQRSPEPNEKPKNRRPMCPLRRRSFPWGSGALRSIRRRSTGASPRMMFGPPRKDLWSMFRILDFSFELPVRTARKINGPRVSLIQDSSGPMALSFLQNLIYSAEVLRLGGVRADVPCICLGSTPSELAKSRQSFTPIKTT